MPEPGKRNGRQCIQCNDPGKPFNVFSIVRHPPQIGDLGCVIDHGTGENECSQNNRKKRSTEYIVLILTFLAETEVRSFHSIGEDHIQKSYISIGKRKDGKFFRPEFISQPKSKEDV